MAMEMMWRRMKVEDATVHGFRSSFRDWAGNVSSFPREVTETALAHVIGDKAILQNMSRSGNPESMLASKISSERDLFTRETFRAAIRGRALS
jgi:hypothetical protein